MTNPYAAPDSLIEKSTPVVRESTWLTASPQVIAAFALVIAAKLAFGSRYGALLGVGVYLIYWWAAQRLISRDHLAGLNLVGKDDYHSAIDKFQRSYEFFGRHRWLDSLRSIILLSSSTMSYREMALCWIAYCHSMLNDPQRALEYYQQASREFPKSAFVQHALHTIASRKEATVYETVT